MVEVSRKIIKLGNSKAITLPREYQDFVEKGQTCLFNVELIEIVDGNIPFKCRVCGHRFIMPNKTEAYCVACGEEEAIEPILDDSEETEEELNGPAIIDSRPDAFIDERADIGCKSILEGEQL